MYTLIVIIILIIVALALRALYGVFKIKINFFITGLDSGFSIVDLIMLWKVASICELDTPTDLFFSMNALSKCMTLISTQASSVTNGEQKANTQKLLSKLFDYRTKLQNKSDDKKGVISTKSLEKGQQLRIIFPGKGVFASKILNCGTALTISVPKQRNLIPIPAEEWVGHVISVYFWRKGDARYVFDSTVMKNGLFLGESALFLKHSSNLIRTQKRKSVRVKCTIPGNLYIVRNKNVDSSAIETRNGYRCILLDISESGALIKIGGKGVENIKLKLQFQLNNKLILMFGVIRTVEFHQEKNISLLHFECTNIEQTMRNEILSFVYNTMPDNEKEVFDALNQTELDEKADNNEKAQEQSKIDKELNRVEQENQERINKINNPNLLDPTKEVAEQQDKNNIPAGEIPQRKTPITDFSSDDIEDLEEVEELEEV